MESVQKKHIIDYTKGLSKAQVEERVRSGCTNFSVDAGSKTVKEIILENLLTYFNLIFAVLTVLVCISGEFNELAFLPVIIANTLIGIIQEVRAKKIVDNLNMLNVPKVVAIRDGKEKILNPEQLVLDDIVIFKAGDQICADAVVCAGEVQVNESLLTGESDEITKTKGNQLMSGSFIVSGECHARLNKVGADSYISKLTLQAKKMNDGEQSEMIRSLNKLVKIVGILIIPIGIILFCTAFIVRDEGFKHSIISMVAAVIGMIPEGLYLLATVALVVSTMRLAKKKVLLHDMKCIETLARVNVLCVDKTGTITENEMKVQDVVTTRNFNSDTMGDINLLLGDFASAMSSDNITMAAIKNKFKEKEGRFVVSKTGFSSVTKYSSVTFEEGGYILGAPEFVLKEKFGEYKDEINEYASKGIRVLVFGQYDLEIDGNELAHGINPIAYILLANPIRKSAKETFGYFAEQGVEIKVISGDNPVTVSEVAKQAGIVGAEKYVDASTLTTDADMREAILNNTVFGRVKPEQKRKFVNILKNAGNTVAMTGDGVNDILALKDADCSIAMASGSEAAAQSAKLVLLDSDFSCMPDVVYEGRRVVNNIERSATLFLVKNIFSFILSIFTMVIMVSYPLKPSQISLISMFTIGIPAFLLALEPNKNIIKGHFMLNIVLKALAAAITDALAVGALVVFGRTFGLSNHDVSTAATILMAIVGFMILYKISCPMNKFRFAIMSVCAIGLVLCSIFLSDMFGLTGMSKKCIMLFVVFSIATEPLFRYLSLLVEKISGYFRRYEE
ncbi:MAG: cation-translocating P-type ATPase [Lachnospiraceae bacterium]|nr:cation-translocating P-type ATPase [Lachnospiraceae bacterium]